MLLSVYCSGSIAKSASDRRRLYWSDSERIEVDKGAVPHEIVYLNPNDPITDPQNTLGQFGRDMCQVMVATAIIVDARERRGLGIGVEMAAAATFGTPIIVVSPRNTIYRSDTLHYRGTTVLNYVHPHVSALATSVVEDFVTAGEALSRMSDDKAEGARGQVPTWLNHAVNEYIRNVLPYDAPMIGAMRRLGLSLDFESV